MLDNHQFAEDKHQILIRFSHMLDNHQFAEDKHQILPSDSPTRQQAAEAKTAEHEGQHGELLAKAQRAQKRLQDRVRGILSQQEDERKRIGVEMRDEITQALLAINLSLLTLNTSGQANVERIEKSIAGLRRILIEFTDRGEAPYRHIGRSIGCFMTATSNQNDNADKLARRYRSALRRYLKETSRAKPASALKLGREAVRFGLDVLGVAAIHEKALTEETLAMEPAGVRHHAVRRAAIFFAEAIVPIEATHRTAIENNARLLCLNREMEQRAGELSASRRKLKAEIAKRRSAEQNFRKSESRSSRLLRQSRELQEDLRRLSRRILTTQEEERKRISRELHDLVAQTLTAINVHLATLKTETLKNADEMKLNITRTQKLVEQSVKRVHHFARDLRPAVLDDLGLIPALRSLLERFAKDTGIRVKLRACAKIEKLDNNRLTVLYRVAQEALTNVARHACAGSVTVNINELPNAVYMRIADDGRAFDVERLLRSGKTRRMGLLGMRERVEMIGGKFAIESAPGKGTNISARVPFRNVSRETKRT